MAIANALQLEAARATPAFSGFNYDQGGHSPGKPGKPGKVRKFQSGQEKVRETEMWLDFERAEELKLQLLAACGPGLWICSSLTLL